MRNFILLITLFSICSCSEPGPTVIPGDVLNKESMAAVLADIHLIEASMNLSLGNGRKIVIGNFLVQEDVMQKHGITKEMYDRSFAFYSEHPRLLSEVYQEVLNTLSQMQARIPLPAGQATQ